MRYTFATAHEMKGFILTHFKSRCLIVVFFGICASMNAQTDFLNYSKTDNITGFIRSCKADEELAIKTLMEFSLGDTIMQEQVWYGKTTADSSWKLKSIQGVDRIYTSLKFKTYYWILKIYNGDIKRNNIDDICVFLRGDGSVLFDYEAIELETQNEYYKRILIGEKNTIPGFKYGKNTDSAVIKLEQDFEGWYTKMKEKGLSFMRVHKFSPIEKMNFKILKSSLFR